jgi:hypothetical protein
MRHQYYAIESKQAGREQTLQDWPSIIEGLQGDRIFEIRANLSKGAPKSQVQARS